jgi:tetratricopeptide (TPR) repeat protein
MIGFVTQTAARPGVLPPPEPFGAYLRRCRQERGWSQAELAEISGLSVRGIGDLENGRTKRPYPDSLRRLADALGLRDQAREEFFALSGRPDSTGPDSTGPAGAQPPPRPGPPPSRPAGAPRQLPAAVGQFVGRGTELDALTAAVDRSTAAAPAAVVISAIGGTAGVGKSALALHWAHQVAARFPDGHLYVNLRGYDLGRPMPAGDALGRFLRALGVPGPQLPSGTDERAALYRSLLATRSMLIVADNAFAVEQVRPLLPGNPACVVVVTSRDSMAGLVARDGATRLDLDLLPLESAIGLLRELIGPRVDADRDAAAALADRCCRLPLALRVAAELAVARPDEPLAQLAGELAGLQERLEVLDTAGDAHTAIRTVFSWSSRRLDPAAAQAFRLVSLHPGADFEASAVAALTGFSHPRARRVIDELARAHLVQRAGPDRYSLHDLLRAYARELAAEGDPAGQHAALTALFDHYLYTAVTAVTAVFPAEASRQLRLPAPATPVPAVTEAAAAREWLDRERANLVDVAVYQSEHGWPRHAIGMAATLHTYLNIGHHFPESVTVHTAALSAARQAGDRRAEAVSLTHLGFVHDMQGRPQESISQQEQALDLFQRLGDRDGEARARHRLGLALSGLGRNDEAARHFQATLAISRERQDRHGQARSLQTVGTIERRQGRYEQAAGYFRQALALCREIGDPLGEAVNLTQLAMTDECQGQYELAVAQAGRALVLSQEHGYGIGEARARGQLGLVAIRQEHWEVAVSQLDQSLEIFRAAGHRHGEAETLIMRGELSLRRDSYPDATAQLNRALRILRELGDLYHEAAARYALGQLAAATGYLEEARVQYTAAIRLATQTGDARLRAQAGNSLALIASPPGPAA